MRMAARVNYPSSYYSLPQFYTVISGGRKTKFGKIVFGNPSSLAKN